MNDRSPAPAGTAHGLTVLPGVPKQLTAVSLFAGVGGIDLGLAQAGVRVVIAAEVDKNAHAVLRYRFAGLVLHDDVTTLTGQQCLDAGLDPENGIIAGGWPCQDLSTAGRRAGLAGERSGLFWHILRLAKETNVAWLVGENVPGLLSSENGDDFVTVCQAISDAGYMLDVELVDAQFFGVPQRRQRLYFVARRADLALGCADPDSGLVSVRLVTEALQGALVAGLGTGWDGYARSGPDTAFLTRQGVAERARLLEAAGRGRDWVGLVDDAVTVLGGDRELKARAVAGMKAAARGLDAGGLDAAGAVAAGEVLASLGRVVAGAGWSGPSWYGTADAVASATEEVLVYAGQQGGSLFDVVGGVHDWDPWRAEAGRVLDAVRGAALARGGGSEVPAVTEGGGGDPDEGAQAGSHTAGAAAGSAGGPGGAVRVAGRPGDGRPDREGVDEGVRSGSGGGGPVHAPGGGGAGRVDEPDRVSAWPIQDGQAMTKAQNGLGVGDDGAPAYTLDTRGLQAVGVAGPSSHVPVGADAAEPGQVPFRKSRRAQTNTDDETWVMDDVRANTVNTFDVGDTRATELIVTGWCTCKRNRDDEWTEDGRHARCGLPTQGGDAVPLDLRATGKSDSGGAGTSGDGIGRAGDPAPTLGVSSATPGVCVPSGDGSGRGPVAFSAKDHGQDAGEVSPTLRAMGHTGSHANGGGQVGVVIPGDSAEEDGAEEDSAGQAYTSIRFGDYRPGVGTLKASDGRRPETHVVVDDQAEGAAGSGRDDARAGVRAIVRRITPVEAERLQGFADGWTEYRQDPAGEVVTQADSARYKQMGNAVAIPCVAWVAGRVVAAHTGSSHPEAGLPGWPVGVDPVGHCTGVKTAVEEPDDD